MSVLGWTSPFAGYRREWLRADLVGGLAAGCVVVPQAMAYATIAGLPVQVGLYTCMVPMAVYALLGGSRLLSVSTTSTIATLTATTLIAAGVAAGSDDALGDLATLVLLVGIVLLAGRLLRLGPLVDNISDAIVIGLKVGVGLTVAAGQLPKLLGVPADPDASSFVEQVDAVLGHLGDVSWSTVALSTAAIAGLLLLARVAPRIPAPLVVVAAGIVLVALFDLEEHGIALISEVPSGLPAPRLPSFDAVDRLLPGGGRHRADGVPRDRVGGPGRPTTERSSRRQRPRDAGQRHRRGGGRLLRLDAPGRRVLADRGERELGVADAGERADDGGCWRWRRRCSSGRCSTTCPRRSWPRWSWWPSSG